MDNIKQSNIHEARETEKIFEEIMSKHGQNLTKTINPQILYTQQTPSRTNTMKNTSRYIITKILKTKDKNFKALRKNMHCI